MSIDRNACYPMLPGKKSKAKCYSINSTLSTQKNNPLQARIPEHCTDATSSGTQRENQPGVPQLLIGVSGQRLCHCSLPAGRGRATGRLGKRKCHPARTQRARWYLTADVMKSYTRKNIFSCFWAKSPGGCRAGLIPISPCSPDPKHHAGPSQPHP